MPDFLQDWTADGFIRKGDITCEQQKGILAVNIFCNKRLFIYQKVCYDRIQYLFGR